MMRWIVKYEPKNLKEMVLNSTVRTKLEILMNNRPHSIIYGKPGLGKSTFGNIIKNNPNYYVFWINASKDNSYEYVKGTILPYIQSAYNSMFGQKWKWVVFNEADRLTEAAQNLLKQPIETAEREECSIMFITNHIGKIDKAIQSRCRKIEIKDPPYKEFIKFMKKILKAEGIKFKEDQLDDYIEPDIRDTINNLQDSCNDGKLLDA